MNFPSLFTSKYRQTWKAALLIFRKAEKKIPDLFFAYKKPWPFFADSNFVLGNAQVPPSYPIVYCSDGFCELTGYPRAQIMQKGCACKFLYGPDTDEAGKEDIADSLFDKTELKLEIQLYKKGGMKFVVSRKYLTYLSWHRDIFNQAD